MGPLKILLLWEGEKAEALRDYVRQTFKDAWDLRHRDRGLTIEFYDVRDNMDRSVEETFLAPVKQLIDTCHGAVALHARQSRVASAGAGNLWLEIGVWLERRGGKHLLLLSQNGPDVIVPTNLDRGPGGAFANEAELAKELETWLLKHWDIAQTQQTPSGDGDWSVIVERLRATCGDPIAGWLSDHLHRLPAGTVSDDSADVLAFVSELLRMGRAVRELADLSAHLSRISALAAASASLGSSKQESSRAALREKQRNLALELDALLKTETSLLRRKGRVLTPADRAGPATIPPDPQINAWQRLSHFLSYRLSRYQDCDDPLVMIHELREGLSAFINRAIAYSDPKSYTPPQIEIEVPSKEVAARNDAMEYFSEYARMLARYLDQLRMEWFSITRESMNRHFASFGQGPGANRDEGALRALGRLSWQLPHNTGDWRVPVWPEPPATGSEGLAT